MQALQVKDSSPAFVPPGDVFQMLEEYLEQSKQLIFTVFKVFLVWNLESEMLSSFTKVSFIFYFPMIVLFFN